MRSYTTSTGAGLARAVLTVRSKPLPWQKSQAFLSGQHQAADIANALPQGGDVGDHQVDPHHVGFGEHQAAVDDQYVPAAFQGHHVEADLSQPSQGEEAKGVGMQGVSYNFV